MAIRAGLKLLARFRRGRKKPAASKRAGAPRGGAALKNARRMKVANRRTAAKYGSISRLRKTLSKRSAGNFHQRKARRAAANKALSATAHRRSMRQLKDVELEVVDESSVVNYPGTHWDPPESTWNTRTINLLDEEAQDALQTYSYVNKTPKSGRNDLFGDKMDDLMSGTMKGKHRRKFVRDIRRGHWDRQIEDLNEAIDEDIWGNM